MLAITAVLLLIVFVPYYLATIDFGWPIPRDGTTLVVGRDFLNFWMYGQAAVEADPVRYYDVPTYWAATEAVTGPDYPAQLWSYPPSMMLLAAPFGQLPYFVALALWTVMGMALYAAALRLWTRDLRLIFPLMFAPAAVFGMMSGQFAYVASAAILTVMRWREERPVTAGILLGLLTLKPQLGLFFPILLLATRNWRLILAAGATALVIIGLTGLLWDFTTWKVYLEQGIANQSLVLRDPEKLGGPFMPTIFMNARIAGASYDLAMAIQGVAAAIAVVMIWLVFRRRPAATDLEANALFLSAAVFGTPYMLAYDSLSLATTAVLLMVSSDRWKLTPTLVYLLPLLQLIGLPGPALVPLVFAGLLMQSLRSSSGVSHER